MANAVEQVPEGPKDKEDSLAALKNEMQAEGLANETDNDIKKKISGEKGKEITDAIMNGTGGKLRLMQDVVEKVIKGKDGKETQGGIAEAHREEEESRPAPAVTFAPEASPAFIGRPGARESAETKPENPLLASIIKWLKDKLGIRDAGRRVEMPAAPTETAETAQEPVAEIISKPMSPKKQGKLNEDEKLVDKEEIVSKPKPGEEPLKDEKPEAMVADAAAPVETPVAVKPGKDKEKEKERSVVADGIVAPVAPLLNPIAAPVNLRPRGGADESRPEIPKNMAA